MRTAATTIQASAPSLRAAATKLDRFMANMENRRQHKAACLIEQLWLHLAAKRRRHVRGAAVRRTPYAQPHAPCSHLPCDSAVAESIPRHSRARAMRPTYQQSACARRAAQCRAEEWMKLATGRPALFV